MAIIFDLVFNHSLLVKTNKILLKRNAAYSHSMSTMKYIQLEPQGDIAILRINRPEALNAMNVDVISELSKMIDILAADDSIKAVVITGAGERSFCAGADISYMVNIDPMQAERYATSAQDVINRIDQLEKPVIAAVNGFALGGGCELAMACDIRIASSNAKIGQTEVTVGIPPGGGGTQRLLRIVGPAKTKELIYTGKMITAEEAEKIGLVNRVISLNTEEDMQVLPSRSPTVSKQSSTNPQEEKQYEQQEKQ